MREETTKQLENLLVADIPGAVTQPRRLQVFIQSLQAFAVWLAVCSMESGSVHNPLRLDWSCSSPDDLFLDPNRIVRKQYNWIFLPHQPI